MYILLTLFIMTITLFANAEIIPTKNFNDNKPLIISAKPSPSLITQIEEPYPFYGLASYYNNTSYFIVSENELIKIRQGDLIQLKKNQWLAVVGRFKVGLIYGMGKSLNLDTSNLIANDLTNLKKLDILIQIVSKSELSSIKPELDQIRYAHLWKPLSWLTKKVESSLITIHSHIFSNWVLAIVIFSVALKIILLPVSLMTVFFQRRLSQIHAELAPKLAEIKANYDGEDAHNRLMKAHKDLGVSPFYTLKPMFGSLIQIPILIAVFNALGEMPQLNEQSFLWINNLAYPDSLLSLPFTIPIFGNTISLLPFIMTVVTLYSTIIFQNSYADKSLIKPQKRNLYLMAAIFFVLFYPFPAVMVLYWVLANILQLIQQKIIKV